LTPNEAIAKPYLVRVSREGAFWVVEMPKWPGCIAHSITLPDAMVELVGSRRLWVEDCAERGIEIPDPS